MSTDTLTESKPPARRGVAGYYIFMAVAILCLYAVNNLSYHQFQPIDPSVTGYYSGWIVETANRLAIMQIPYTSRDIISCLWAINLFLAFCILGNFSLLLFQQRWHHHLVMLVILALAILVVYVVYRVFPFELPEDTNPIVVRIILWVIMALLAVGMVLRLFHVLQSWHERERPPIQPDLTLSAITAIPADIAAGLPADTIQTEQSENPQWPPDNALSTIPPGLPSETVQPEQPGPDQIPPNQPISPVLPPDPNKPSE
jgi:hypothetical protein